MDKPFKELSTVKFQEKLRPHAIAIYKRLFGEECQVQDLKEDDAPHILDKEFAVDCLLTFPSGHWVSIQEKYRRHKYLSYGAGPKNPDFTQEVVNAAGTPGERPGEWFNLGAQLYFLGWANANEDGFAAWVILDIPRYKLIVEKAGGIYEMGKQESNREHGRADFVCIPVQKLSRAWVSFYNLDPGDGKPRRLISAGGRLASKRLQEVA